MAYQVVAIMAAIACKIMKNCCWTWHYWSVLQNTYFNYETALFIAALGVKFWYFVPPLNQNQNPTFLVTFAHSVL